MLGLKWDKEQDTDPKKKPSQPSEAFWERWPRFMIPQAQDFHPRRDAAAAARLQMKQVADVEQCEL